mmetsp:Transcript_43832/g.124122  ORF Transcript_43832/g.124122 Transcript_43832/m.124122 type:complete len:173 (+) Transcript_43832:307-825(+)
MTEQENLAREQADIDATLSDRRLAGADGRTIRTALLHDKRGIAAKLAGVERFLARARGKLTALSNGRERDEETMSLLALIQQQEQASAANSAGREDRQSTCCMCLDKQAVRGFLHNASAAAAAGGTARQSAVCVASVTSAPSSTRMPLNSSTTRAPSADSHTSPSSTLSSTE